MSEGTFHAGKPKYSGMTPAVKRETVAHLKQGKLVLPSASSNEPVIAPLVVCDPAPAPPSYDRRPAEDQIRIMIGEVRLEVAADSPAVRLPEVACALGAASC